MKQPLPKNPAISLTEVSLRLSVRSAVETKVGRWQTSLILKFLKFFEYMSLVVDESWCDGLSADP